MNANSRKEYFLNRKIDDDPLTSSVIHTDFCLLI